VTVLRGHSKAIKLAFDGSSDHTTVIQRTLNGRMAAIMANHQSNTGDVVLKVSGHTSVVEQCRFSGHNVNAVAKQ
jgi:hypothetical protein